MSSISALENIHQKGQFGDYEGKSEKNLIKISEIKNLIIVQIVQYKNSNILVEEIKIDNLKLSSKVLSVVSNENTRILWNGPRNWLIMTNKKEVLNEIGKNFSEKDFAVTDISHSKSIIELQGDEAKEVLKKGCPFNFNELYKNNCLNSTFNGMSIIVDMINDKPDTFRIFSLRSFGESLYHSLTDASLEFGYIGKKFNLL